MSKLLSIVIPAYKESQNISMIYKSITSELKNIKDIDYEFIFVNDGSPDNTRFAIKALGFQDKKVKGINLSRNFGKEVAISAGIEYAIGDAVLTIDADGQHPVDKIPLFIDKRREGYDIVYNKRPSIKGVSRLKKISSDGFYRIFNKISEFELEGQTTDYRLIDRKVVNIFKQFGEKNRIYRGLIDWIGFDKFALEFDALPNPVGREASYSYKKLRNLALNTITSFSIWPLKFVGYFGLFITIFSGMTVMIMGGNILFGGNGFGFTNLGLVVAINTLLGGIMMMSIGLIAVYIGQIHEEIKDRPLFIAKDLLNIDNI